MKRKTEMNKSWTIVTLLYMYVLNITIMFVVRHHGNKTNTFPALFKRADCCISRPYKMCSQGGLKKPLGAVPDLQR